MDDDEVRVLLALARLSLALAGVLSAAGCGLTRLARRLVDRACLELDAVDPDPDPLPAGLVAVQGARRGGMERRRADAAPAHEEVPRAAEL